jgi:hypothetical protein
MAGILTVNLLAVYAGVPPQPAHLVELGERRSRAIAPCKRGRISLAGLRREIREQKLTRAHHNS